jgi:hyperosmotically inducible periplasmic protein
LTEKITNFPNQFNLFLTWQLSKKIPLARPQANISVYSSQPQMKKMKKLTQLMLSGVLVFGAAACSDTAKTSADAPNNAAQPTEAPATGSVQDTQQDAASQVRRDQLNSDIRAREQRNNITGGDTKRADDDLESEVRSKLEANIQKGQLTVDAEDGVVTVGGTVPNQQDLAKISPLAKEIKGVTSVKVNATVVPAKPQ